MLIAVGAAIAIAVITAVLASRASAAEASKATRAAIDEARADVAAQVKAATLAAVAEVLAAETAARTEALNARMAADELVAKDAARVDARETRVEAAESEVGALHDALDQREDALDGVHKDIQSRRDRASGVENDARKKHQLLRQELEQRAGVKSNELMDRLSAGWLEDARARAAAMVRQVDQTAADPAHDREAKRVMEVAATRYHHHYLTERAQNFLRLGPDLVSLVLDNDGALKTALEKHGGVQLLVNDEKDAIRLDGLDGVGKEFIRRAFNRIIKKPETVNDARKDFEAWAAKGRDHLTQEIRALGKRAFQMLGIPKAHPEIVELVGALNFRTSYTQNQWWHAVESAYLAGMMAEELGLDVKLARRATLMHDIGKALTHKIEGSHAVIGADIARRVGESELVANAIGAHHADETCNSVYAYLVAASDAMSGARPGARRELAEGFTAKVEDLERIGYSRRGVEQVHAVHGGRELRVYVRDRDVDDVATVEMSTEIAAQISEEMTFPGQIKVTVIRSFEASSTAN